MPRAARFTISVIEDLFRQLEYAPADTRHRQMDAAERLIDDIDPQQNYPEDFIVYRVTGYRPESRSEPALLVGRALIQDLANLVLRLSHGLALNGDAEERKAIPLDQAARRLNVSTKTLQRYRRQGLVCHAIVFDDGVQRVACFEDALNRFVKRNQSRVNYAGAFSRIDSELERKIIEEARQLRLTQRLSRNDAAKSLARAHGRAHETVRQLLVRHDRRAKEPIFANRGPLDDRTAKVMHRAWQWGIEPAELAMRFGKSKATVHRAINRRRAEMLRRIDLEHKHLDTFDRAEAGEVILSPAVVREAAAKAWPMSDALGMISQLHEVSAINRSHEEALAAAHNFLLMQCKRAVSGLESWPHSEELDEIETMLRWAGAVRTRLVWLAMPAAIGRIEQNVGRPIEQLPRDEVVRLILLSMRISTLAAINLNLARGQRLERAAGYALDRELARAPLHIVPGRAAARHAGTVRPTIDPQREIVAWSWLLPPVAWQDRISSLEETERRAIAMRFGWSGQPPMTCAAVAQSLGVTSIQIVRILRAAQIQLRRARGSQPPPA